MDSVSTVTEEAPAPAFKVHPALYGVRSLRHTQFRNLWLGQTSTTIGNWMDQFTRGWLVYTLTDSAAHLAFVSAARAFPLLFFGLWAGVLADRVSRRRLLMVSQSINVGLNVLVGVLILSGAIEVWQLYVTAVGAGIATAVQQPARQSIIPSVVPKEDLQNAVVLNSGTLNIGQAVGPAIAGVLVAAIGMGSTYLVQAMLYVLAIVWTFSMIDPPVVRKNSKERESTIESLKSGFAYVKTNQIVLSLLTLALVPMFFGNPYQSLVPIFAAETLELGSQETSLLIAATGIGSVLSLIALAVLPPFKRAGRILVVAVGLYGVTIVVFAASSFFLLAAVMLVAAGFTRATYRAVNHTMLLSETEDEYRGRVNSMYLLDRGLVPLGTVVLGLLAAFLGASTAMLVMGALCTAATVAAVSAWPRIWRI